MDLIDTDLKLFLFLIKIINIKIFFVNLIHISQFDPVKPDGHAHVYPFILEIQFPPFLHGLELQ